MKIAARGLVLKGIVAGSMIAVAGVGLAPPAGADVTPTTIVNGILATFGGCQSAIRDVIVSCTDAEILTRSSPLLLDFDSPGTTVVVLGAGLLDDGAMRPMLVERLQAALSVAEEYPASPIITSGGAPKSGVTEARAMRDWLVGNGIHPDRITEEGQSGSTVQNAQFSARLLAQRGASGAVVVSSANHVERALVDFRTAVGGSIPVAGVIAAT